MKSKEVIFRYGHFWCKETGKRIIFKEKDEYTLVTQREQFEDKDDLNKPSTSLLDAESKEASVCNKKNVEFYNKILPAGSKIYFNISIKNEPLRIFELVLDEDLYVTLKSSNKKDLPDLEKCTCRVVKELTGNLDFFEELHCKSLNNAHEKTFVHFFSKKGSPTSNAFDTFYTKQTNPESSYINRLRTKAIAIFKAKKLKSQIEAEANEELVSLKTL